MTYKKQALITGITGQDGLYLTDLLVKKGYKVHGVHRRSSTDNPGRFALLTKRYSPDELTMHYGDLTDSGSLFSLLQTIRPDELYNLAAQSDVAVSFVNPEYSANVNALGTLRLLEGIRTLNLENSTRFYQASTSELFGLAQEMPQKETTPFYPRSPYAVSKCYAYWITVNYRESYGFFACNGILFNHESPVRAESFVTRKITRALGRIMLGLQSCLYLGNLDAMRDWGHTADYVEMQWSILQQDKPEDYIIATGEQHSVREFVTLAAKRLGISLVWRGKGIAEQGVIETMDASYEHVLKPGVTIVKIDPQFFRPSEVETLLGDPTKAYQQLGWKAKITFGELVTEMTHEDYLLAYSEYQSKNRMDALV